MHFTRAITTPRDEPLADARLFRRLHLLHGDASVLPCTLALKCGTTALALDLLEIDQLPKVFLADAVTTFRALSHQPDGPWLVPTLDGGHTDALELLARFHETARAEFHGRDEETDALLELWGETLAALAKEPEALVGRVDWVTKRRLFRQFIAQEKLAWDDPWLRAQDLEYHHTDPARSLGRALEQSPEYWALTEADIRHAMREPPADTRAAARSHLMHRARGRTRRYFVDWEIVDLEGFETLHLLNPFRADPPEPRPMELLGGPKRN